MQEPMTGVLRPDIELIGGKPALLFDPATDAYFKVSPETLKVVSFLTVSQPVEQFREALSKQGVALSKEELLQILGFLQQNNLLVPEYGVIGFKRKKQAEIKEKTLFLRFSAAYLFFRLPPIRPERFFEKITPAVSWLASKFMVVLLLIPAVLGYLLILRDFNAVQQTFWNSLSWAGLVKYFAAIVLLKIIHESAHSIAAMHFRCRVRGIGLGFMVFYPRLYTDTTDSWRLPRNQRLLIDSAGIIAELLFGGTAALLWCYLPPGPWKSTMFYVFAVSTISTLLVNGNPCIRYDGYYILCDLVNIENLMSRSSDYVKRFWRWHVLRLGMSPTDEKGGVLFIFGVLSSIYRIFLYTSIILIIYHKFTKALAVVMMFMELYSILIYPFWREVVTIRQMSKRSASHAGVLLSGIVLAVLSVILFYPLSWNITLPGETVSETRTVISIAENGYLTEPLKHKARPVGKGETLFVMESPVLEQNIRKMEKTVEYDQILWRLQQLDEKLFAIGSVTEKKMQSDLLAQNELKRRKADLRMTSPVDGIFVPVLPDLSAGVFLPKGCKVGEVVSLRHVIRAYSDDYDIGELEIGNRADILLPDQLDIIPAEISDISMIAEPLKDSP